MSDVLLIETDPAITAALRRALAEDGPIPLDAGTVPDAQRHLQRGGIGAVILDLDVPDAEGLLLELAQASDPAGPAVLVILPEENADARIAALGQGAADILRKPVDPSELRAKVRAHLELKQLREAAHRNGWEMRETMDRLGKTLGLQRQFLSLVTHDLRTPLTTVKLTAELLRDQLRNRLPDLTPAQENLFAVLLRNILRIEGSFNEIMNVTRFDTQAPRLRLAPLDVNAVVEDAISACAPHTHRAEIRIRFGFSPLPRLRADGQLLHQLVVNLLSLCLARMDIRDHATVETAPLDPGVRLRISDTGPHLDPANLRRIQEGLDEDMPSPRTRVGLYLAHRTARAHGGTLTLESAPGSGLAFVVDLPLAPAEAVG